MTRDQSTAFHVDGQAWGRRSPSVGALGPDFFFDPDVLRSELGQAASGQKGVETSVAHQKVGSPVYLISTPLCTASAEWQ